jgi:hypothetical protein
MTAGHFGLAAGVKAPAPRVPLWALMLSTYLLDFVFIILVAAGAESFGPLVPGQPVGYGEVTIQAFFSHSLVGAAFIALVAGLLARQAWGKQAGVVIGAVVMSHWFLDLIVHRPDLPILPGNALGLPLLGLGLWNYPLLSAAIELVLALGGTFLYYRSAQAYVATNGNGTLMPRALVAATVTGVLIMLLLATDVLGLSLALALVLMLLLIVLCGWLDARLQWSGRKAPAVA